MPINYTAPTIVAGTDHQTDAGGSTPLTASFMQTIVNTLEAAADGVDALNAGGGGGGGSTVADNAIGRLYAGLSASSVMPVRIAFAGSSTTAGTGATLESDRYVNRIIKALQTAYPASGGVESSVVASTAMTWGTLSSNPGIHGYNGGEGGTTSADYMTDTEAGNIAALDPCMVMHMIGSNDLNAGTSAATYKANVLDRVEKIKTLSVGGILPVQVLVHSFKRSSGTTTLWGQYKTALQEIATADPDNVIFVDTSQPFYAAGVPSPDPWDILMVDGIHHNDKGHRMTADLILRALNISVVITGTLGGGGGSPASATYVGTAQDLTDAATYTITGVGIGAADSQRVVIIHVAYGASASITLASATIGGVTATIDAQLGAITSGNSGGAIIRAAVPTGTTATVVLNFTGTAGRALLAVYRAIGAIVVDGSATNRTLTTASISGLVNTNGGFLIAGATERAAAATGEDFVWTGAIQDLDTTVADSTTYLGQSVASSATTGTAASVSVTTSTPNSGTAQTALLVVSYSGS